MNLNQPFYIEPRKNGIDLCGEWELGYTDVPVNADEMPVVEWQYKTKVPSSIYHSLYDAGVLGHPYVDLNNRDYRWVDEKVWYYKKEFSVSKEDKEQSCAILCFDGVAYYSKVWLNDVFLGEHEGMFGGPFVNVNNILKEGINTVLVEVKACTYGKKDIWKPRNDKGENREIVPWDLARNEVTNNQEFIVLGMWNKARLELLPEVHISRPYLQTDTIDKDLAKLTLDLEIVSDEIDELKTQLSIKRPWHEMNYVKGLLDIRKDEEVTINVTICEKNEGPEVFSSQEKVALQDYANSPQEPLYRQSQFYRLDIDINNPKLWWPCGMGEPFLYNVKISLSKDGQPLDELSFDYGIKTFCLDDTDGPRFRNLWGKYKFVINNKPFFLKGMNWFQMDMLLKIDENDYRWALELAKNQGIQLIRIWSGGGIPEMDCLYQICDELGILVWQDHPIANQQTPNWPQEVLEAQVAMNIFRIRNHTSLAMHCGGNEFNPYALDNAASMFVIERNVNDLDPQRPFVRTTPDKGSAHVYRDFEPTWYRNLYKALPFLAESGIHCFPTMATLNETISKLPKVTPDLSNEKWCEDYPEVLNHFIEYEQARMDRICARASHINSLENLPFAEFVEAVQISDCDFYQIMIEAMRENYPVTGGIMPWAFKRPWPNIGVMMVDGLGRPVPHYYYVKNSYTSQTAMLCLEHLTYAPGEEIPLNVAVINDLDKGIDGEVLVVAYNPDMSIVYQKRCCVKTDDGMYKKYIDFEPLVLNEDFTDKFVLIKVELWQDGKCISRSIYWPKCMSFLQDKDVLKKYRTEPQPNINHKNGPWLKPQISKIRGSLFAERASVNRKADRAIISAVIKNESDIPLFPVFVDVKDNSLFYASDNYFLLDAGEERKIEITLRIDENTKVPDIGISAWNADEIII